MSSIGLAEPVATEQEALDNAVESAKEIASNTQTVQIIYNIPTAKVWKKEPTISPKHYGGPPNRMNGMPQFVLQYTVMPNGDVIDENPEGRVGGVNHKDVSEPEAGFVAVLSNGDEEKITKVSSRQVKTETKKFRKSDYTEWGSDRDASDVLSIVSFKAESDNTGPEIGGVVELSDGSKEEITNVSKRQIKTENHKFRRSDHTLWGSDYDEEGLKIVSFK